MKTMTSNRHDGSSFDDFLKEDGIYYEECNAVALKRVLAWQIKNEMRQPRNFHNS